MFICVVVVVIVIVIVFAVVFVILLVPGGYLSDPGGYSLFLVSYLLVPC